MTSFITPPPEHIAIIMDGNGRWAKERSKSRSAGHEAGAKRLKELIAACLKLGVKELSVFAFSTENWARPEHEVDFIFRLLASNLAPLQKEFLAANIRFCAFGNIQALKIYKEIAGVMDATAHCSAMRFNLGLNYGALDEAARAAARLAASGKEFSAQNFFAALDVPREVDLLIRTGGRARLSNFMLLQSAYAQIEFCDSFFPDFTPEQLEQMIENFQRTPRTFGATNE